MTDIPDHCQEYTAKLSKRIDNIYSELNDYASSILEIKKLFQETTFDDIDYSKLEIYMKENTKYSDIVSDSGVVYYPMKDPINKFRIVLLDLLQCVNDLNINIVIHLNLQHDQIKEMVTENIFKRILSPFTEVIRRRSSHTNDYIITRTEYLSKDCKAYIQLIQDFDEMYKKKFISGCDIVYNSVCTINKCLKKLGYYEICSDAPFNMGNVEIKRPPGQRSIYM